MAGIFTLEPETLGRLGPDEAVEAFRDLLWCQARLRSFPVTKIDISGDIYTADGGIDAEIDEFNLGDADELFVIGGTRFQIKAGTGASPWQRSWAKSELFNSKDETKENLGSGVRRCFDEHGRYVLACFGIDFTPEQLRQAKAHFRALLDACGYSSPKVAIWGQSELAALFSSFPSLTLKLTRRSPYEFQTHLDWGLDTEMSRALFLGPKQEALVREIRECLLGTEVDHIRLIGEPGVGKTRIAYEATNVDELRSVVAYVRDAEDFPKSPFFNALLRSQDVGFVILVVDECATRDRASIWRARRQSSWRLPP